MRDVGLIKSDEPFKRLLTQGMVTSETYYRDHEAGKREFFNADEVDLALDDKGKISGATLKSDGQPVIVGGVEKMSKSKNNGVDPQKMIDKYGADTVRLFTMFAAPPEQSLEWNDDAIAGGARFLRRVWGLFAKHSDILLQQRLGPLESVDALNSEAKALRLQVHTIIQRAMFDYDRQQFNTVVAAAMELTNAIEKVDANSLGDQSASVLAEACHALIKILAPVTPHLCEHLWDQYGTELNLVDSGWLTVDESALVRDEITYVVQVNGKLRAKLEFPASAAKEEIEAAAQADINVQRFLEGVTVRKVIVVPNKLVNIVAN